MHLAGGTSMLMMATSLQSTFEVRGYRVSSPFSYRTAYIVHLPLRSTLQALCSPWFASGRRMHLKDRPKPLDI
jgi:hypothetical protein